MSDPAHIPGWQRISATVTTSGKLVDRTLCDLAELGVVYVIDLAPRDHAEALELEDMKLAEYGIGYHNIPVDFSAPTETDYAAFKRAYKTTAHPVHVHCIANHRVSVFLYRYHLESGMDEEEARRILRRQWLPDKSDHPLAQPWKLFVEEARQRHFEQGPQPDTPIGSEEI